MGFARAVLIVLALIPMNAPISNSVIAVPIAVAADYLACLALRPSHFLAAGIAA